MMKHEFEAIAGYEVSNDDYNNIIEPMYMATGLSKVEFAKTLSRKRFALKPLKTIVNEMRSDARSLKETCTHYRDDVTRDHLENLVRDYIQRKHYPKNTTFHISDAMIWSCYYPVSVEIFNATDWTTYEFIIL